MTENYNLRKNDNPEYPYIDENEVCYYSPENWFWIRILEGCGCGKAEEFAKIALELFLYFGTETVKREYPHPGDVTELEIFAHWMDSKGLLEHGYTIYNSWLSDKGEQIYQVLKALEVGS